MAPLIFYHFQRSAPSRAALLAVRNLGIDVEIKEIDLFNKAQLSADFIKVNPQHCVPTIDDEGFVLWESRAVAQYLVETRSPDSTLIPKDLEERATFHQRLFFDLGTLYARVRAICYPVLYLGETTITQEKRQKLTEAFTWLNEFLDGKKWVVGDHLTLADLSILATLSSIIHVGANISQYRNIARWYEQCESSLPGFEENDAGAKLFAQAVNSKLIEKF